MRLQEKVVLITGSAGGMGKAAAELFAREGASIIVTDVVADAGEETARDIREAGGKAIFVKADVSKEDDVKQLVARGIDAFGSIDVLYNNAGIMPTDDGGVTDLSEVVWDRIMDVNLKSAFFCTKHVVPHMLEKKKGSIINVASFVAVMGSATSQISYTASKGGVLAMSRELGVQYARSGIRVNALCPGPVNTPLLKELFAKDPERAARRLVHVPVGRFAEPEEIAAVVAFLASDDASFITASTFLVDGGISSAYVTPL